MTVSRETRASAGFALAWLLVLTVLGTQATSEDGKGITWILLIILSTCGCCLAVWAMQARQRYSRLAFGVSALFAAMSILFGIAAFS